MKGAIKTEFIGGRVNGRMDLPTGVEQERAIATWSPQEDIRIIAVEVGCMAEPTDALSNTDGAYNVRFALSRSGLLEHPGSILMVGLQATWNGIICIGGKEADTEALNFGPNGVDIDHGASVNLLGNGTYVGTGTLVTHGWAIIHYVER